MGLLSFRPWLILLAAAGIAILGLELGYLVEQLISNSLDRVWAPQLVDLGPLSALSFAIILLTAILAGRLSGINVLHAGIDASRNATIGLVLGLLLVVAAVGGSFAIGSAQLVSLPGRISDIPVIALASLAYLLVAVAEEALFRGWAQPLVARYTGGLTALVLTSIVFALAHDYTLQNHPMVTLNLFLGGLVMGLLALKYGGIAAPVMFHFGWNWADYFFFALTPNPGRLSFGAVFDVNLEGTAQAGGVADGLMANIFATLILLSMAAFLLFQLRKSGSGPIRKRPVELKKPADTGSAASPVASPQPLIPVPDGLQAADASPLAQAVAVAPVIEPVEPPMTADAIPATLAASGGDNAQSRSVQTATHQGCVRELNEDRFLVRDDVGIFVVADGMGGHKFGDRASTLIVEHVSNVVAETDLERNVSAVSEAILSSNRAIHAEAQTNGSRMGSTVVSLLVDDRNYAIIWAGDSRAYRLRNGHIEQLTKDHTQVQEMVDRGLLQPQDVARHPMSHVLVRAVGVSLEFELDVVRGTIESGDVYFLCSDGIYDVLDEDEIAALLAKSGRIDAMEKMISMALDLGARDNVTGIIVRS